jgi:hypothetical protein
MRLNQHARIEIGIVMVVILGSCSGDGKRLYSHDEIEDIASDVAYDAVVDSDKTREIEGRIEAIELRLGM